MRIYLSDIEKSITPYAIPVTNTNRDLQYLPIGAEGETLTVVGGQVVWALGSASTGIFEIIANKVTNFLSPDNTTYPTTQAVADLVNSLALPNDATISINGGGIATGGGSFTTNQATYQAINVYVPPTNLTSFISGNTVTISSSTGSNTTFNIPSTNNGQLTIEGIGLVNGGGTFTANQIGDVLITLTIPNTLSSFTNDVGFITEESVEWEAKEW